MVNTKRGVRKSISFIVTFILILLFLIIFIWAEIGTISIVLSSAAPNITSHYPSSSSFSVNGNDNSYFNITDSDSDGSNPDSYWYVDGILRETDINSTFDEFSYSFGCGISGLHNISVVSTDGTTNDSIEWNVSVSLSACSSETIKEGSSGGGFLCFKKWECVQWSECKNLSEFDKDEFSIEIYESIIDNCYLSRFDEEECGFQTRNCVDVNNCRSSINKPEVIRECQYTQNPTCFDGILNCHDRACESGIDCGGPCSFACEEETPLPIGNPLYFYVVLSTIFSLIIFFFIIRFYNVKGKKR